MAKQPLILGVEELEGELLGLRVTKWLFSVASNSRDYWSVLQYGILDAAIMLCAKYQILLQQ
ncbi:MAG: hypothetical protein SNH28_06635 [Rikenellaceae bacterium]